ncbi:uncharacterized protein LOC143125812 isoform X2 [Alosa pseudoharengus]|uniref:uncharacterized protein LOC143125812 isoform X2 n=1 Tax=Alosa pseudoharengus TaxID=34774 RepID=UPI003F886EBF
MQLHSEKTLSEKTLPQTDLKRRGGVLWLKRCLKNTSSHKDTATRGENYKWGSMNGLLVSCFVLVHITDVVTGSVVSQPDRVIISKPGDNVTVKCITPKDYSLYLFWYQQRMGQMLRIMCMAGLHTEPQYYNEFEISHFSVEQMDGTFNLKIRNSTWSDEAIYYCARRKTYGDGDLDFGEGTFVRIKDDTQLTHNTVAVIESPTSDSTHPAHSEPLQCAAVRETRTEEFSLFWFGPATRESRTGLISTYRNSSSTCETRSLLSCMHELTTSNDSNAATCYCAVQNCGQILFGNETASQTKGSVDYIIHALGGTICLCAMLDIFLIYLYCKKKACLNCQGQSSMHVQANTLLGREASDQTRV